MKKILIIEDQTEIRLWIQGFVGKVFPEAEIDTAATLTQARTFLNDMPDLWLIDLSLPDGLGYELIDQIKQRQKHIPCVVITSFDDDDFLFPALKAGADGYLLKDQPEAELEELLSGILNGNPPISPAIAFRLFNYFKASETDKTEVHLSRREKDTLQLISRGYSVKECAQKLDISHHTVSGYVKEIYRKLEINSRAEAAIKASQMGLY